MTLAEFKAAAFARPRPELKFTKRLTAIVRSWMDWEER